MTIRGQDDTCPGVIKQMRGAEGDEEVKSRKSYEARTAAIRLWSHAKVWRDEQRSCASQLQELLASRTESSRTKMTSVCHSARSKRR